MILKQGRANLHIKTFYEEKESVSMSIKKALTNVIKFSPKRKLTIDNKDHFSTRLTPSIVSGKTQRFQVKIANLLSYQFSLLF